MTVIPGSIRRRKAHVAATGLASLAFAVSGAADLVGTPAIMASLAHLGYPAYAATILGFWKVLGAAAIATPFAPRRLKEWAYAGMFFDLTGAAASHAALGDAVGTMLAPLGLLAVVMASWALQAEPEGQPAQPTWMRGRSRGLDTALRSTSRVSGAVSPSPSAR
jgi:hypothetical protein